MIAAHEALTQANQAAAPLPLARTLVSTGTSTGGLLEGEDLLAAVGIRDPEKVVKITDDEAHDYLEGLLDAALRPKRLGEARGVHVYEIEESSLRMQTFVWRDKDWGLTAERVFPRGREPLASEPA